MRTIQMTLDENLVKAVDRVSKQLNTSRSAFTRKALRGRLLVTTLSNKSRNIAEGMNGIRFLPTSFRLGKPSNRGMMNPEFLTDSEALKNVVFGFPG